MKAFVIKILCVLLALSFVVLLTVGGFHDRKDRFAEPWLRPWMSSVEIKKTCVVDSQYTTALLKSPDGEFLRELPNRALIHVRWTATDPATGITWAEVTAGGSGGYVRADHLRDVYGDQEFRADHADEIQISTIEALVGIDTFEAIGWTYPHGSPTSDWVLHLGMPCANYTDENGDIWVYAKGIGDYRWYCVTDPMDSSLARPIPVMDRLAELQPETFSWKDAALPLGLAAAAALAVCVFFKKRSGFEEGEADN